MKVAVVEAWRERVAVWLLALRTWPWIDTARTLKQRFREDHLGLTAGSLTFTTLISLVPLVTVMLAVFSAFPMFATFQGELEKYLMQALVPPNIAKPVLASLTQFAAKAQQLGAAGLAILVITALTLMLTIDRTLNEIWRVRTARPIAQRVLVYWAAATLGPLLLGLSLSVSSYLISASRGFVGALPGGVGLMLLLFELVLQWVGAAALFRYVPNTHVRWAHAWAGGVFVAIGFELAKRALGWYVKSVPTISVVYGAFATVPIFLLWIYVSWLIVLLGAVVAAYAPSLALRVVRLPDRPGERFALAVAVLRALVQARAGDAHGLSVDALAGQIRIDPLQVEPVLEDLAALGWCGRLDEEGAQRHVLLIEPARTPAQPLVDRLLLAEQRSTAAFRQHSGLARMTLADLLA